MGLLYYISHVAIVAAFAFVTLSLASGLLYVSELIEEHSRLAKITGQRAIYAVIALHVLLYFSDNLPFFQTGFSILCHLVYLQNFSATWPLIQLTSIPFVASCILVISDHFIWFYHFARITNEARRLKTYRVATPNVPGFTEIAAFFGFCVWLAPLFLFLSLSANDNALPMSAVDPPGSPLSFANQHSRGRVSLIRTIFSFLSFDAVSKIRTPTRKDTSEGLIAPRTPNPPPRSSSPLNMVIPPSPRSFSGPPPRSPLVRTQELDVGHGHLSPNSDFKLRTPPRRSTDGLVIRRSATSDGTGLGLGIGLQRTSSFTASDDQ